MKRIASILGRKEESIGSAALVLISMVLTSRVLGLIRDRLLNARFDPRTQLDVYFAAFRLPNLFFELLVMGALTSAFIPVFSKYISEGKERDAMKMTATLINISLLILFALSIPTFIWAKEISQFLAPGFSPDKIEMMARFTRIMIFFQVPLLLVGNYFTGILQSYNRFIVPALAPLVYNIGIILAILFLSGSLGLYAPVMGVGLGALLFCLIQVPLVAAVGYRHSFAADIHDPGVREVGKLIGPRTLGLAVSQIDSTVDLMMASLVGAGMITYFNYAQQLQQLPVSLFGQTIAQAALPTLSTASAKEDKTHYKNTIVNALHQILFFVLPISVFFIVLRIPIIRLVFGASRFDWQATVLTGMTLSAFSISLPFQAAIHVLARGFYAVFDTKTPVAVGVISILLNTILSIVFVVLLRWPVWSLGLSTSIASIVNGTLLLILLDRRIGGFPRAHLLWSPVKMVVASVVMGIMLYVPLKLFDQLVFDTTRTFGLIFLTGTAGVIGLGTYFFLSWVFAIGEVRSVIALLSKVRKPKAVLLAPAQESINGSNAETVG